ncbi:MAG: HAD hydrolase-like protein, partial [Candidatus Omnitrophica bacterium]|nr:HAD hydrolase-like protein [Candidatus Omnitrophota bacterium]
MSSRFSLICFDLDGTLIDSRKDISDSINRMLRTLELPEKSESVIAAYVGNGMSNLIRQSLGEHHETLFDRALKIFRRDYDEHCVDVTTLYPGVREAMTKLTEKKVIVTNKPLHFTEKILKSLAIRDAFDRVMGG